MRNKLFLGICALGVVAIAFGAGLYVQREFQLAKIRTAESFARDLVGLNDPVPPPPRWEEWGYPGADIMGSIQASSVRVSGELVRPAGRYAVLVTPDPFESVARFYAEKAGFEAPDDIAKRNSAVSTEGNIQGESNHLLDDFHDSTDYQSLRPVRVKCLLRRSPSYDLTVVISRANEEKNTHIALFYDPRVELEDTAQ